MGICTVHPCVCEPRPNLNQALLKPLSGRPWGAPELGESSCSPVDRALGGSCEAGPSLEPRSKSPIKSRHRSAQLGCLPKCPKTGRRSTQPAVAPATWHFRPPSARERERDRSVGSARGARSLERGFGALDVRFGVPRHERLETADFETGGGALAGNKISQAGQGALALAPRLRLETDPARLAPSSTPGVGMDLFAILGDLRGRGHCFICSQLCFPFASPVERAPYAMALNVITESRLYAPWHHRSSLCLPSSAPACGEASEPDPRWFGNPQNPPDTTAEGWTNQNWLKSRFHFSFAEYHEGPSNFGVLRVMNDDLVQGERGFGEHPHRDMEIMTFIVDGELTHKDSKGNEETLGRGAIQFMTAGTGIYHSEHNLAKKPLRFIQCWVVPRKRGLKPNYGSSLGGPEAAADRRDKWAHMVSDEMSSVATQIKIHQDCNVFCTELSPGKTSPVLNIAAGRQAYMLCVEGEIRCEKQSLHRHDAAEVKGPLELELSAGPSGALVLLFEMAQTRDSRAGF
ncbi:unnamed protein product [Symbiodinium sp. CCMP2456]|nr:unnamed protein product [Symbiodinium sp. CCMP2456]